MGKKKGMDLLSMSEIIEAHINITPEQLEELNHKPGEDSYFWLKRNMAFFLEHLRNLALFSQDEKVRLSATKILVEQGMPPRSIIEITPGSDAFNRMSEEEARNKIIDKLMEDPTARKMLEDRMNSRLLPSPKEVCREENCNG